MRTDDRTHRARRIAPALLLTLLCISLAAPALAGKGTDRLQRKVRVMERVLDEVLIQSPNVVVSPGRNTRGLILEGCGALFTFEGSVNSTQLDLQSLALFGGAGLAYSFIHSKDGQQLLVDMRDEDDDEDEGEDEAEEEDDDEDFPFAFTALTDEQKAERAKARQERLEGLKQELIDALLDYGPTLSELDETQHISVVAYLDGSSPLLDGEEMQLVLQATVRDLRQVSSGQLSREKGAKRIQIQIM